MIHIVTALPCEAKPVIQHYRLKNQQAENGFRIYENDFMRLIISGIGKCAAAAASAYLQGIEPKKKHIWLNHGIAGHGSLKVGESIIAHKIVDAATSSAWYPPLLYSPPCQTATLISVERTSSEYEIDTACDMEASGFFATASRFNSSELVQVYKVISDNDLNPAHRVTNKLIQRIIGERIEIFDSLIQKLQELNSLLTAQQHKPELEPFLQCWHFTMVQQHRLQRLLQQWQAMTGTSLGIDEFGSEKNSKAVLTKIESKISSLPLRFD